MIFDLNFAREILQLPPGENRPLAGVSIDSRSLQVGELFAAIRGPRFDGHDYVERAVGAGCGAVLVERVPEDGVECPVLVVDDVLVAMERLATAWRLRVNPQVIGVTGSSGKTTVKELVGLCCQEHFKSVHTTRGNLNNHYGVPLTLLAMPAECELLVVEMGMSGLGEIASLTKIARPDVGIVTNVLAAHLAAFSGVEQIAQAKGELFVGLAAHGVAVMPNGGWVGEALQKYAGHCQKITFGQGVGGGDVWADGVARDSDGVEFVLHWPDRQQAMVKMACHGGYMVDNALAAAAACRQVGVAVAEIVNGLAKYSLGPGRGAAQTAKGGWVVVDDSYNANPGSVKAAIAALAAVEQEGRRVLILGDMLELGKQAESLHKELAEEITKARITLLFTAGPLMKHLFTACKNDSAISAHHQDDPSDWLGKIAPQLRPGDRVLVKGSRGMRMERIVKDLSSYAL